MSDAEILTKKLVDAGATIEQVIAIIDGYGDPIDWGYNDLKDVVGTVWDSDINCGDDPENWIINEICRQFNVEEVTE